MNNNQALVEYVLNKFGPYIILLSFMFTYFELTNIALYVILGCVFFIDRFSFKIGRSLGEYENNPLFKRDVDEKVDFDNED